MLSLLLTAIFVLPALFLMAILLLVIYDFFTKDAK
jgi:hypothetical protein